MYWILLVDILPVTCNIPRVGEDSYIKVVGVIIRNFEKNFFKGTEFCFVGMVQTTFLPLKACLGDYCRSNSMQFFSRQSYNFKIARVNHSAILGQF